MTALFDVLVIGGDEASLCAAACGAKTGAHIGLVRLEKKRGVSSSGAIANIPNSVWRRLDLQNYGFALEPVSARITLFGEGAHVTTFPGARETKNALTEAGLEDGALWEDFIEDISRLDDDGLIVSTASGAFVEGAKRLADLLGNPKALDRVGRLSGSCLALLGDYFNDSRLKDHVAAHALAPMGYGGMESGSARALIEYLDEDAWRVRPVNNKGPLCEILETVCAHAGVELFTSPGGAAFSDRGKNKEVRLDGDKKLKTRSIFFATPDAAIKAGAGKGSSGGGTATAVLQLKLEKGGDTPDAEDKKAIFQIIDSWGDLQTASDAAAAGRLPENLPVEFEFDDHGGLIARSAYCPAAFYEDGEWRGWTGQDRQAAEARIRARLSQRLPGLAPLIRKSKIEITGAQTGAGAVDCDDLIIQPHRHNAVSAAVKLMEKVIAGDR